MKRSFTSLSPQETLAVAISIEHRNAELYQRYAEMFTEFGDDESLEIATVFEEMAGEEHAHGSLLRQKYGELYGSFEGALTEEELVELIEVPKLHESDVFSADSGLAPRGRALQVALQAEQSAQRYYATLVDQTPEGELRHTYRALAQMEDAHVAFLETRLARETAEKSAVQ